MSRAWLPLVVLLLLGHAGLAAAGKGYSSGGGSHSSGSHSSGSHSSSSHSSSSSGSHSSSSSGGKSYSSGGKSYSSGSSSSSKSYSSGSTSKPSSGTASPRPSSGGSPSKPAGSSYDSAASKAAQHAESKATYQGRSSRGGKSYSGGNTAPTGPTYTPGSGPRSTYNDASGRAHPIDPKDRRIDQLRRELNEERWYNRQQRSSTIFYNVGPPTWYPTYSYSDPYSNLFIWWLLSQSLDYRSNWMYNHYDYIDRYRYRDLLEHDQALEARIRVLEAQKAPRDPAYAPPGVDPDLMYTDQYVDAAVNPTVGRSVAAQPSSHGWGLGGTCFVFLVVVAIFVLLVWLIFIKRWGGSEPVQGRKV